MKWLVGLAVVGAAACGGTDEYDGLLKPPPANDGMQLDLKLHVEPGQEITACKNFPIPSGTFDIGRFEHAMTAASHHLLVFPILLASTLVTDEVFTDCDENPASQGQRIGFMYGSQSPTGEVAFPKGYAFGAMSGIAVQVEFHIFNTGDEPVDAEAAVNLWRTREDIIGDAGTLFAYNTWINIPAMSTASARQRCPIADSLKLMTLTPHMHSHGVAMQVFVDHGAGTTPDLVVDAHGWDEDTVVFDPPLELAAGDMLDVRCDYNNPTSEWVSDGSSAKHDEMCVTGGLYYRDGARLALQDEVCVGGEGVTFTGTNTCPQIEQCERGIDYSNWNTSPTPGHLWEQCISTGCQAGAEGYLGFEQCRWNNCRPVCYVNAQDNGVVDAINFDSAECTSCVDASCASEHATCTATTCP